MYNSYTVPPKTKLFNKFAEKKVCLSANENIAFEPRNKERGAKEECVRIPVQKIEDRRGKYW